MEEGRWVCRASFYLTHSSSNSSDETQDVRACKGRPHDTRWKEVVFGMSSHLFLRHVALADAVAVSGDRVRPSGLLVPPHHSQQTVLVQPQLGVVLGELAVVFVLATWSRTWLLVKMARLSAVFRCCVPRGLVQSLRQQPTLVFVSAD